MAVSAGEEEEVEEAGGDHGLAEDLSVTYRHGRDLAGFLVEVLAGGYSALHGGLGGIGPG